MLRAPEHRAKKWIEVDQKLEKMMAYDNNRYEILKCYCSVKLLLCDWIILFYYILLNYYNYIMYILTEIKMSQYSVVVI